MADILSFIFSDGMSAVGIIVLSMIAFIILSVIFKKKEEDDK